MRPSSPVSLPAIQSQPRLSDLVLSMSIVPLYASQFSSGLPTNNAEMVAMLMSDGCIHSPDVIEAFRAVDRGFFIDPPDSTRGTEEVRYVNAPFRNGPQHLSAPGIYGTALEALSLAPGLSFLNVCSGTGYLSALASQILGTKAVHCAVELRKALVIHAREKLAALGLTHVDLRHGSCLALDPDSSMRFSRIYVGAGADEATAALLFGMLEVGGVLVGPFADADGVQTPACPAARGGALPDS